MRRRSEAQSGGVFTAVETKHPARQKSWSPTSIGRGLRAAERAAVSVAAILLATAERTGAGLIFMGAYTHGRMQQIAFGGVTNHVMQNTVLPVLMAHLIGLLRPRQPRRGHQSARRALTAGSVGAQAHNEPMSPVIIPQASLDAWKPHA
jgi:hypothetical protein